MSSKNRLLFKYISAIYLNMFITIICTGTELLTGSINTDDAFICEKLNSIGLSVNRVITVGDSISDIKNAFREALNVSDMVFTVGGLGPTFDDLTRDAVADVLQARLVFNREVMHKIAAYFAQRGLSMPEVNDRQAYIIEGAVVMDNKIGTAPGMFLEREAGGHRKIIVLLPGPPREMNPMVENFILPLLRKRFENRIMKAVTLHICGLTESAVFEKIREVVESERKMEGNLLSFTILASIKKIDLRLTGSGDDELLLDNMIHKAKSELYERLKEDIYGEDSETLEEIIAKIMCKKKITLSVAESCTGGIISSMITDVPGSSLYFRQGFVAYSNEAKIKTLKVSENTLKKYGAVSPETAGEMAAGVRNLCETDIGLATTGIAGPAGGTEKKPVGLVFVAISKENGTVAKQFNFGGNRADIKTKVAWAALDMLRRNV